ncbi:cation diffusion facilitator family transporter [Shewanella psychrophila]|uniref:Cation diffusion facilitator family transporter n=1 Tax=Shewanella psychrophila TaxID=225848 RepID=A0A1S6HN23_9GAMM|nr:cation diffusion facilitator family transporter [Shewanella psychrophila]AQS36904.1 cation diffusion facilitator family transporter [Shewanella psychrophila]
MAQDHDHNAPGHTHGTGNQRAVGIAAILTGGFMIAEVVGGLISGSLALIADAGHMLTDFVALSLAWFAFHLAKRPASWKATYGFDRFSVLAALVNGLSLFLIAAWICFEAIKRLNEPVEVLGGTMLLIAVGGLIVNILAFWILTRGEKDNLNIKAALLHVAGDLLGSVGAIIASLVIIYTGWTPIDPILSVFVAIIILRSAWHVVRESGHILLEGAPRDFDRRKLIQELEAELSGVIKVRHVHAWSITQERPMITLEVDVNEDADTDQVKIAVKTLLKERFNIAHSTVEINQYSQKQGSELKS